jgi:hypothetical protein
VTVSRFGVLGPKLHRAGWDVIPIPDGEKRPAFKRWQHGLSAEQVDHYAANGYARGSVGLLARGFPAVDVDVLDAECALAVQALALEVLGDAPVRVGKPPKRLLMYRCDTAFAKVKVNLAGPGEATGIVEVLSDGQQYLIYGRHPEGHEYEWVRGAGPGDDCDVWQLTAIDQAAVSRLVQRLSEPGALPQGWSVVGGRQGGGAGGAGGGAAAESGEGGDAFALLKAPLEGWPLERVVTQVLPHLDPNMLNDQWAVVGMALHHQGQGSEEWLQAWDEWSQPGHTWAEGECAYRWGSFKDALGRGAGGVTLATLLKWSKEAREKAEREGRHALLQELQALVAGVQDAQDLPEKIAPRIAQQSALNELEREQLAVAIRQRTQELTGVRLQISAVRSWLRPKTSSAFAHVNDEGHPLCTLENMRQLLSQLHWRVRYNVIKKAIEILIPGQGFSRDNRDNAAIACVLSECEKARMPTKHVAQYLIKIADENQFNPVAVWVESKPWDGVSRLEDFYATVRSTEASERLKKRLLRKWLIQCVAAAFSPDGIATQGILTFVGPQNIGKTTWFQRLAPPELDVVLTGHTLDTKSKDSTFIALTFWLVELGEVDATMRKSDISALKSFITQPHDKIRRPYAATESSFGRRTAFGATVNDEQYLHDPTGNRRFWTIEVESFDLDRTIDMQQLWAEVLGLYQAGERWFLDHAEVTELNAHNDDFTVQDPIEERIAGAFDWSTDGPWRWVTATEVLMMLGVSDPSRYQAISAGRAIKRLNKNQRKKSNGRVIFAIPAAEAFLG